jgi:hypothetical protein
MHIAVGRFARKVGVLVLMLWGFWVPPIYPRGKPATWVEVLSAASGVPFPDGSGQWD